MSEAWIATASPVILLGNIGQLDLLESLAASIRVPDTVVGEIQAGIVNNPLGSDVLSWTTARRTADVSIPLSIERWDLGSGESQVIAHCLVEAQHAVMDDAQGRECARAHSVSVIGTVGIVLRAKRQNIIPVARPILEKLRDRGMYLSDRIFNEALILIGE